MARNTGRANSYYRRSSPFPVRRKRNWFGMLVSAFIALVAASLLAALIYNIVNYKGSGITGDDGNTDPRQGKVYLNHYDYKYCDGSNLVYKLNRAGSVVPNSPECING